MRHGSRGILRCVWTRYGAIRYVLAVTARFDLSCYVGSRLVKVGQSGYVRDWFVRLNYGPVWLSVARYGSRVWVGRDMTKLWRWCDEVWQSSWGWSGYDQVDVGVMRYGSHDWE